MGSVVSFSPRSAAVSQKRIVAGMTASVIIFPGVRYERPKSSAPVAETDSVIRSDTASEKPLPRH